MSRASLSQLATSQQDHFDPNGEVILLLTRSALPFAAWNADFTGNANINLPDEDRPRSAWQIMNEHMDLEAMERYLEFIKTPVEVRASSRHLILASPVFKQMLQGRLEEAENLRTGGVARVNMTSWDATAVHVVMNIIHGKMSRVPLEWSVEMAAKIAALVDFYDCFEVVSHHSTLWMNAIMSNDQYSCGQDVIWRLARAWVFRHEFTFTATTKWFLKHMDGPFPNTLLPIPQHVISEMERRRVEGLRVVLKSLHEAFARLVAEDASDCQRICRMRRLGMYVVCLKTHGLIDPRPTPPYAGLSLYELCVSICAMSCTVMHDGTTCMVDTSVSLAEIKKMWKGLRLADFK